MTTASIDARSLPRALRRGLGRIDRRLRTLAVVGGIGRVALVLAVLAALGMAADFFWPPTTAARWAVWSAWVGAGIVTLGATAIVPLMRRTAYSDLAAVAERGNPSLGERLTSAVELLGQAERPHGSPAFIEALGEDAERRAAEADLMRAVSGRRAANRLLLGIAAVMIVAAPAVVRPDPFRSLADRFLMPWADVDRVGRFLVKVTPGDAVAAVGSDVAVVATVTPRFGGFSLPDGARLEWTGADTSIHQAAMTPDETDPPGARTFRLTVPRLSETVRYRVVADSAESRRHTLRAVEPPAVSKIVARVEPPSYTKLPAATAKNAARVEAWKGSVVTLSVAASKPLAKARLEWPAASDANSSEEKTASVKLTTKDGATWTAAVPAEVSGNYSLALEDENRIPSRPESPRRLVVRPDMPPTVALGGSADPRDAQGDDLLVVDLMARDDLAVAKADLLYAIDRAKGSSGPDRGEVEAKVAGLGTRRARGEASLGLKSLGLQPGDVLTYRVRVADNRPAPRGPNVTITGPRALRIVAKADPLLAREKSAERQSLQDQLNEIKRLTTENRQEAQALRYAADAAGRGNGTWDDARQASLVQREGTARSVVDKLHALARDFADSGQFAALSRPTTQIADVEAEAAREKLDAARQAADAAKRLNELRASDDRLASVKVRLDELQQKFDELVRLDDDRRRLREMAEKQEDLAKKAEELAENGDRGALDRLQQEQDRLRWELDEIARRSPELKAEALAARAKEADNLARRARDLAARQREEARKTADPAGRAEKLRALAEAQRKVEEDARKLAMEVDRPLEENGRGRLDAGAMARPIEPIQRGEIEPGRQRLEEAEDSLRRLGRDLEDVRDDPKALARRLARRQEALTQQTAEIVRQAQNPEQKKALAEALKPLAEREEAIRKLAAAIPVPENLKGQAKEAVQSVERSRDDLKENKNEQVQNHQNEARDRLNRLADALPDANQRRQQAMQAMQEAKNRIDQVSRELDNHLRDTAPRPGQQDFDPDAAARELARRVAPLAERQAEAVQILAAMTPDRQAAPQRDRALRRAQDLADTLDALRDAAPAESQPSDAKPNADWRVLAPFDDAKRLPPFPIDRPIDLKAPYVGRKGKPAVWKPVQSGDRGRVDLGALYSRDDNQSAFAYAEVASPVKGKGRLLIGSDDNCTIWLNGKRVYDFGNSRAYSPAQDRAEVTFEEGVNRLILLCGNGNAEWAFSVSIQPPKPPELAQHANQFETLREAIPAQKLDATAAVERLDQKLQGRVPADDRAAELAADLKEMQDGGAAEGSGEEAPAPAEEMRRVATALRNLQAPDAVAQQAEAVRRAEHAAKALAENAADAEKAKEDAKEAADALAEHLNDADSPREQAAALADAERGLNAPDASRDPRLQALAQRDVAAQLAAMPGDSPQKQKAVEAADRAAALAERRLYRPDSQPSPRQIAEARDQAAAAIEALAQAAEPGGEMAGGANGEAPNPPDAPNAPTPQDRAEALAARQHALADKAKAIEQKAAQIPKDDKAAKADAAKQLAALARDQKAVAEAARALADPLPANSQPRRDAEKVRNDARAAQAQAAGAMAGNNPSRAAQKAQAAAEALDRLAKALPDKAPDPADVRPVAPPDPELAVDEAHADAARVLARRERQIRERLQSVLGERVEPQERLRDDSAALGRALADVRDGTRELSPRAQGPANAAAEMLQNQAPAVMNEGTQHLAAGRPDPARDAQRRAAETLERAAQQAEDLAAALRSEVPAEALAQAQAGGEPGAEDANLASARDAQRQASGQLTQAREAPGGNPPPEAARAASAAMQKAAQGLRAAAASKSKASSRSAERQMAKAVESSDAEPTESESGRGDASLAELKESIKAKTGRNWGELPGHLRSEILQMSQGKYRDDYARLIQLYFREIAAGRDEVNDGGMKR